MAVQPPSTSVSVTTQDLVASATVTAAAVEDLNESEFGLLLRLDRFHNPGLPMSRFASLFCACNCGQVMTRRTFLLSHDCPAKDIIDLTLPPAAFILPRGSQL